jgi:hypothetical protein
LPLPRSPCPRSVPSLRTGATRERRERALAVCDEFDALLNGQWAEGYSAAEVERLAEFRERHIVPLRAALAEEPARATDRLREMSPEAASLVMGATFIEATTGHLLHPATIQPTNPDSYTRALSDEAIMRGVAAVTQMRMLRVGDQHDQAEAFREAAATPKEGEARG